MAFYLVLKLMSKQQQQNIKKVKKNVNNVVDNSTINSSLFSNFYFHYFLLFLGALIVYGWTANFDFCFDDSYITDAILEIENVQGNFLSVFSQKYGTSDYRPITILSFWIEKACFGILHPGKAHLINTLIFGFLLTRIYKLIHVIHFNFDKIFLTKFALLVTLIFLIHPNHVSVVANIKSRDTLLSMSFGLMSAIQCIQLYDDKKWWRFIFIFLFFALAILSKLDAYVFAILPIIVFIFYRNFEIKKIALFIIFAFFIFLGSTLVKDNLFDAYVKADMVTRITIDNPLFYNDSFANRISIGAISLLYYLKFLVVPFGYYFYFGYNQIPLLPWYHPLVIFSILLYVSLGCFTIYYFKKNRIFLFGFLFFLISIAYASNVFIPIAGIVMDRYNFIASLGFCLVVAYLLIHPNFKLKKFKIFYFLLFFIFIGATFFRTAAWKNKYTLYNTDIKYLSNSAHANQIIGSLYINSALFDNLDKITADNNIQIGENYVDKSLKISNNAAAAWESKAICALYKNENLKAIQFLHKATNLDSSFLSSYNYIGVGYRNLNNFDSASYYFNYVMVRENYFGYSANNLLQLYAKYNMTQKVDTLFYNLMQRFPNNVNLITKYHDFHH